jgi:hypothetical protein
MSFGKQSKMSSLDNELTQELKQEQVASPSTPSGEDACRDTYVDENELMQEPLLTPPRSVERTMSSTFEGDSIEGGSEDEIKYGDLLLNIAESGLPQYYEPKLVLNNNQRTENTNDAKFRKHTNAYVVGNTACDQITGRRLAVGLATMTENKNYREFIKPNNLNNQHCQRIRDQGRASPILLQFFYLFSIFFLNHF